MKSVLTLALVALFASASASAQDTTSEKGKLSYAIGYDIGTSFVERKMDVDVNTVIRAIQDGYGKRAPAVPKATMVDVMTKFQQKMMTQAKAEYDKVAGENRRKSQQFLATNKAKKGIVTLPSGLQYRIIEDGSGKQVTPTSEVTLHYRGSLPPEMLEFDSSFARGEPIKVKVNEVIKGWQEILPKMRVGAHWQVFVPADLAYGERGNPPRIGPEQALVFDLKVVDSK